MHEFSFSALYFYLAHGCILLWLPSKAITRGIEKEREGNGRAKSKNGKAADSYARHVCTTLDAMTLDENLVDDADHARGKGKRSEDERWGEVGAWS